MFEDFGKKLVNLGQNVMKKTGEVTEIATLHTKVLAKKKKINDEMLSLGKAYYEAHKDESMEFTERIAVINNLFTEISSLESEIRTMKEKMAQDGQVPESAFEEEEETVPESAFEEEEETVLKSEEEPTEAADEEASEEEPLEAADEATEEEPAEAADEEASEEEPTVKEPEEDAEA